MILIAAAALLLLDQTPPSPPALKALTPTVQPVAQRINIEERCLVVVTQGEGMVANPFPALQLAALGANAGLPGLPVSGVQAIRCERSAFGLGEQDYRVLTEYRTPLIIASQDAVGMLEMVDGVFRLRMLHGGLTDEGATIFRQVLDRFTEAARAANAAQARTSPASPPAAQKQGSTPSGAPARAGPPARR